MPYAWRCLSTGLLHVGPGYPQPSQAPATFCGFKCQTQMGHTKPVPQDRECTSSSALVMPINFFFHPQRHQKPIFLVNLARLVHYNASKPSVRYCSDLKMKSSFVCQHTQDCWLRSSCGCISNVVETKLFDGCFCSSQKVHKHSESS